MANNSGGNVGNVCPKCGTKLGQKNICPICGRSEPNTNTGNERSSQQKSSDRVCPKCGTKLGQKNICPICVGPERETDHAGGNSTDSAQDYVSSVIDFVADHPDDWDDEFNTFYEQQRKKNDSLHYKNCLEACTRIHEILKSLPKSGKISGTLTLEIMNGIREVFSGISEDDALGIVTGLSKRKAEQASEQGEANPLFQNGIREIGKDAFRDRTDLTSVVIPDSVKEIGNYTFRHCTGLASVTIPDSVMSIGTMAFEGCESLASVVIPNKTHIDSDTFDNECRIIRK